MIPAAILRVLVQADGIAKTHREIAGLDREMEKAGRTGDSAMKKIGGAAKLGLAAVAGGAALVGPKLIDMASDAEETASKFRTVFGKETRAVTRDLDAFSKATGTSKFALRDQAAGFQALIRPMGLTTKNAAGMSSGMTKLATDLASFNNTSVDEAIMALKSGLVGEAEPLRRYGVQLSAARIEAFAYAKGIAKSGAELTSAQKAQASYGLILQDTKLAQGDAVRTSGSFANQFKRLKSQVTDTATEFGIKLLPVVTRVVGGLTGFIGQMKEGEGVGGTFVGVLRAMGGAAGDVVGAVKDAVKWFGEHETVTVALGVATGVLFAAYAGFTVFYLATAAVTGLRLAMLLLNASFLTNPVFLLVAAIAALAAGVVVAYKESETFRKIVDGAWRVVKVVAGWLITAGVDAFEAVADAVKAAWTVVRDVTKAVWDNGVKQVLTAIWSTLKTLVTTYFNGYKAVVEAAWETIRTVTRTVWGGLKDFLEGAWDAIKAIASTTWDAIRAVILDPMRAARDRLKDVWDAIKGAASDAWGKLKDGAHDFATGLRDTIVGAFESAVGKVVGFVNKIIGVVNKIPGVEIPTVKLAQGGEFSARGAQAFARGGAYARTGGLVTSPITLMGEEAPRYPEYVIPTNPAYRRRAQMLAAQASADVGLARGGQFGGLNLPSVSGLLGSLPSASSLGWLSGLGSHVLEKVGGFIKQKLTAVLGRSVPGWGVIDRLAREMGLSITSTYRNTNTFHGQLMGPGGRARATDYSNGYAPTPQMMAFAQEARKRWGSKLLELFYSPMGGSVKNGAWAPGMIVGGPLGTPGNHYNHVHVAFARGGKYGGLPYVGKFHDGGVAPEEGLAHVAKGERMTPAGAAGVVLHAEIDLGRGIRERVRLEFDDQGRQMGGAWSAGVLPT